MSSTGLLSSRRPLYIVQYCGSVCCCMMRGTKIACAIRRLSVLRECIVMGDSDPGRTAECAEANFIDIQQAYDRAKDLC
eukprot:2363418-Rhodomonas_salina.3